MDTNANNLKSSGSTLPPPLPPENLEPSSGGGQIPPKFPQNPYPQFQSPPRLPKKGAKFGDFFPSALLNLNGFGIGYFLSGNKMLGIVEIIGTIVIMAAAYFLQSPASIAFWVILLICWVVAHAVIGAIKSTQSEKPKGVQTSLLIPILIGIGILAVEGGLFMTMRNIGANSELAGSLAYRQLDFKKSAQQYGLADAMYRLTFSDKVNTVEYYKKVSRMVIDIENLISQEKYADVPDKVVELLKEAPGLVATGHELGMKASIAIAEKEANEGNYSQAADDYAYAIKTYLQADNLSEAQDAYLQVLYKWAGVLKSEENYAEAVTVYNRVANELPALIVESEFVPLLGQTYLDLSEQLANKQDFQNAIANLKEFQSSYPNSSFKSSIDSRFPDLYLELARQELKNKSYSEAVADFEYVFSVYPNSSQASTAKHEIVDAYLGLGDSLAASGNNQEAYDNYKKALDLDITEEDKTRVTLALGRILLNIGKDQISQGLYIEAEASLLEADGYAADETLKQEITDARNLAISSLAGDSGTQGSQVMNTAINNACNGKPGGSSAINYFTDRAGKAASCGSGSLSSSITASVPGELRYVVSFSSGTASYGSCPYRGVSSNAHYTLYRYQYTETVTIRRADTGASFSSKTFSGGSPGSCPTYYTFYGATGSMYGSAVNSTAVENWILSVIK